VVENREDILTPFGDKFVNAGEQNRAAKRARPGGFALPACRPRFVHRRCSRPHKDDHASMVFREAMVEDGWLAVNFADGQLIPRKIDAVMLCRPASWILRKLALFRGGRAILTDGH
jgi:hypothetical protein